MKKYIVLSVNDNKDYIYHVPLTCWAWRQFGWEPIVMVGDDFDYQPDGGVYNLILDTSMLVDFMYIKVKTIEGYRSATIAQISRLYAACFIGGHLMTSDIDLLPLGDHWPVNGLRVYGHDLTGYSTYPISFISMTSDRWADVMRLRNHDGTLNKDIDSLIKRDLDSMPNAKSEDFYKWWGVDQELITQRLKPYKPTIINRGQYPNGFARGRVDRGAWTLDHKEFIDCHMHHQIHHRQNDWKYQATLEMLHKVWPDVDFTWYENYHHEFKRLTGHG